MVILPRTTRHQCGRGLPCWLSLSTLLADALGDRVDDLFRFDWARRDRQAQLRAIEASVNPRAVLSRVEWWARVTVRDWDRGNLVRS
jgi:hypothetical protein